MVDNMLIPTEDLVRLYRRGEVIGAHIDADSVPMHLRRRARYFQDQARDELPHPRFETAPRTNWKAGEYRGKRALLWHFWANTDPSKALMGNQLTGDCVSWGERCKQDIRRCVEIYQKGEQEAYIRRQATCLIYSGRGHTGQGASPSQIANWVLKCGILLEGPFTDASGKQWDFSDYPTYVKHGISYGRTGMPQAVIDVTKRNCVLGQSRVDTTPALCDLLLSGYPGSVGFSKDTARTGNPVSKLAGSTAHQTCIVGYDDTELGKAMCKKSLGYEDTVIFYDQSWGRWNTVTDIPEEWKPWGEGMYCHSARDVQKHLNERECYVCTQSIQGFIGSPVDNLLI